MALLGLHLGGMVDQEVDMDRRLAMEGMAMDLDIMTIVVVVIMTVAVVAIGMVGEKDHVLATVTIIAAHHVAEAIAGEVTEDIGAGDKKKIDKVNTRCLFP